MEQMVFTDWLSVGGETCLAVACAWLIMLYLRNALTAGYDDGIVAGIGHLLGYGEAQPENRSYWPFIVAIFGAALLAVRAAIQKGILLL